MRRKGSRFTLGVWGLRVCSLGVAFTVATVRNRPQPSATVRNLRNRPQPSVWGPYGRAYGKFCRGGDFWRFPTFRCFVSRGKGCTSWHSDVFCNVSKVALCGRRNTFATFSEDVLHFSWQAQHFRRVVLRVYCKSHWQGCVKWRQGANSVAGVAFRAMCWKLTEASHQTSNFEVANFQVLRKTRRKTSILKLQSVKIGGSLARNARFGAPTCLVSGLWFPVASPCLWGKLQNLPFCHVANCENWRKSRTKCWFFCIHVSWLESLVFLWRRRVYGGRWKTSPIRMCPSRLSCRFAWQVWHFVTFNLFDNVSKISKLEDVL